MSQPIRRVVAVTGLAAALLLMVPAPSRAASRAVRGPVAAAGFVTRTWSWLEGLLGASGPAASTQRTTIQRKDGTIPPVMPVPAPPPGTGNGQGSMIDPDGVRR
jgi:hypothetical protein